MPGHSGPDSKSCTKIGEATLPNRQRNRPAEGERKNDPIPLRCTPVYRCLKNAEIVRQNPAVSAPETPSRPPNLSHISFHRRRIRSDEYTSEQTAKTRRTTPPFVGRQFRADVHLSPEESLSALLYPSRAAGQPGPQAENREWGQMDARRPLAARDDVSDARRTHQFERRARQQ